MKAIIQGFPGLWETEVDTGSNAMGSRLDALQSEHGAQSPWWEIVQLVLLLPARASCRGPRPRR